MLTTLLTLGLLASPASWDAEVVYQIFPRSFRDSNGDRIGDLRGVTSGLDYLKRLGVTAILLNPIVKSRMYHNYFADDFLTVDPTLGSNADFEELCRQAHRRHMKVLLDTEFQYVADRHPWYDFAKGYTWPDGFFYTSQPLPIYQGGTVSAHAVDPQNPKVRDAIRDVYLEWTRRGVDGFRIDHMMDDFDFQKVKTGMLASFWRPIVQAVKRANPSAFFVGEQADWGDGTSLFSSGIDAVFGIPLAQSVRDRDFTKVRTVLERYASASAPGHATLTFIENHDMNRFASVVQGDPAWERFGAVLNMTLPGVPILYYGQEIGMKGMQGKWGGNDGNDIPVRLAMRWSSTLSAPGTATWYRDTGPWWSLTYSRDRDGISVEEQERRPESLLAFYRALSTLRRHTPALQKGSIRVLSATKSTIAYLRTLPGKPSILVAINAGTEPLVVPAQLARPKVLHGAATIRRGALEAKPGKFVVAELR